MRRFILFLLPSLLALGVAAILYFPIERPSDFQITQSAQLAQAPATPTNNAQQPAPAETSFECQPGVYCLSTPLPTPSGVVRQISSPSQFLSIIYQVGLAGGALLAMAIIIFNGIKYTASAGSPSGKADAKQGIMAAIYGLVLLLVSTLILITINPDLRTIGLPSLNSPPPPSQQSDDPLQQERQIREGQVQATKAVFTSLPLAGVYQNLRNQFLTGEELRPEAFKSTIQEAGISDATLQAAKELAEARITDTFGAVERLDADLAEGKISSEGYNVRRMQNTRLIMELAEEIRALNELIGQ